MVELLVMLQHHWWLHFYFTVIVHKDIPYMHDRIPNNVAQFLRHNNTTTTNYATIVSTARNNIAYFEDFHTHFACHG